MNIIDKTILGLAKKRGFIPEMFSTNPYAYGQGESPPPEYGDYLQISSFVYTCVTVRAQLLSSLPIKVYRLRNGKKEIVEQGNIYELLQKVNPFWTFGRLIEMTEMSLGTWGAAFWFLERGDQQNASPREIWFARPDRVRVIPDKFQYIAGFDYYPIGESNPVRFGRDETVWFRYPNPIDEYSPLSPLQSVRISADYALSALRTNKKLFDQGINVGGLIMPKSGGLPMDQSQAVELEEKINARFGGLDKAHRWGVLRFDADIKQLSISPRDAEFIQGVKLAMEDIARVYKIPLDLIGGQRTFENFNSALKAAYTHAVLPEATFIAQDITEQLLPHFRGEADLVEFDASDVEVLQEAATEAWQRARDQISAGALLINEYREEEGLDPLPWGDVWWASGGVIPISSNERPVTAVIPQEPTRITFDLADKRSTDNPPADLALDNQSLIASRFVEYGSNEHRLLWRRFDRNQARWERRFAELVRRLFERQLESILAKLGGRTIRAESIDDPFDMLEWVAKFRKEARLEITDMVAEAGADTFDLLKVAADFSVTNSNAVAFIERRAQRFAQEVNQTTWDDLRSAIAQDIKDGKPLKDIKDSVRDIFTKWSSADPNAPDKLTRVEMIARTETVGALNGGALEGYRQSGLKVKKAWLAALDNRTRETHVAAHSEYQSSPIGIDDLFYVGGGAGLTPGDIGLPEEDINCRCTVQPIVE